MEDCGDEVVHREQGFDWYLDTSCKVLGQTTRIFFWA